MQRPRVHLGLDIDGVFHPDGCSPEFEWVHLERFQEAMREVPDVAIVMTTYWRTTHTLDELRAHFAPDIAARIVGATPDLHAPDIPEDGRRQLEMETWMREHAPGASWLALDDRASYFEPGCPNLLLVGHDDDSGIGLQPEHLMELVDRLRSLQLQPQLQVVASQENDLSESIAPKKLYIVVVAVSLDAERMVLLTKDRGPEELLGKLTFPGGRFEVDDLSAEFAARRELLEETGVDAPLSDFIPIGVHINDVRELHVSFVACDISGARTMESEAVVTVDIAATLEMLRTGRGHHFAPDFLNLLERVLPRIESIRQAAAAGSPQKAVVIPCDLPNFQQGFDRSRPHRLMDTDAYGRPTALEPNKRHQLVYEYTDNGETVVVPNAPYNQTPAMRAAHIRWEAATREERVKAMRERTPTDWTPWMVENVAVRLLANAAKLRVHADRLESGQVSPDAQWDLESEAAPSKGVAAEEEARERAAASAPTRAAGPDSRKPRNKP